MTEPWFSPQLAPYFSLFSLLAAMASLQRFAERGTRRNLVLSSWYAAIGFGALMLVAALVVSPPGSPDSWSARSRSRGPWSWPGSPGTCHASPGSTAKPSCAAPSPAISDRDRRPRCARALLASALHARAAAHRGGAPAHPRPHLSLALRAIGDACRAAAAPSRFFKLENLQMTGSFKERGALNKILQLDRRGAAPRRDRGVGGQPRAGGGVPRGAGRHSAPPS